MERISWFKRLKNFTVGGPRSLHDKKIFHNISLIAFFAWIGFGSDGLTSSCYGPEAAFVSLGAHPYLSIFVAIGTVLTIFVLSTSYSQIIELFPHGGGGYLVASKLLTPVLGMISGCALLIGYVLTIVVSVSAGADAIFSFLPPEWYGYRLSFAVLIVLLLILLNMRGAKEAVLPLVPIFIVFIVTHVFIILYSIFINIPNLPNLVTATGADIQSTASQVGVMGVIFLVLRAYTMGAGTFTGIEAVSNGVPFLREPKVETGKKTMRYMAFSLSFLVLGLMVVYLLLGIYSVPGKTLNAVLFERATASWGWGQWFVWVALFSEATLLFAAAQTGFLGAPRVLANMAADRWFPAKFSSLSDRLVILKGILITGGLSVVLMVITQASVKFLVVFYSISVFITFVLSTAGMVRYWWSARKDVRKWALKFLVNGVGFVLTSSILVAMLVVNFRNGGWITLAITGTLVLIAALTKQHYKSIAKQLRRLNGLVTATEVSQSLEENKKPVPKFDSKAKTAVLLVNGFNGMGLHTLFGVIRLFGDAFKNFVFLEVGMVDAGNFKGIGELDNLKSHVKKDLEQYVNFMRKQGYYAESVSRVGVDAVDEVVSLTPEVLERFPNAVFFGGQLVFDKESFFAPLFHNYAIFSLQKRLYQQGIPFVILPIRV